MDLPSLVRPGTVAAVSIGTLEGVPGLYKKANTFTSASAAPEGKKLPLTKADLPTYSNPEDPTKKNDNNTNTIRSTAVANKSISPLTFDTSIIYQTNMLQRPLITPVQPSSPLRKFQTRDLLVAHTERVQHATVTGRLQSPQAIGIATNVVNWQNKSRQVLQQAHTAMKNDSIHNDLIILGSPTGTSNGSSALLSSTVRPHTSPATTQSSATLVQERYTTARDRELMEQREAADLAQTLQTWRVQRKLQNERIEKNIQLRRRPRSANLSTKVDYRSGIREALIRPSTVGSTLPTSTITNNTLRSKTDTTVPTVPGSMIITSPTLMDPNNNNNNTNTIISMNIGNKPLTLDFPSPVWIDHTATNAIHDAIGLPFDSSTTASRPGTSDPSNRTGSRPSSSRPGSRGILSMINLHGMENPGSNTNSNGIMDIDPPHMVKLTPRLNIPIIITRPATVPIGTPKGNRHRNRPSMVGWWHTEGRNQAKEREQNAKLTDDSESSTVGKHANVPIGPAGVPLVPEASIEPVPDLLNSMQQLRNQIDAEDDYDIEATTQAFEKKGVTLPSLSLSHALKTSTASTSVVVRSQQERPVTASSGLFGLGENPVAREKRLAALKNQILAAAKKAGGGKGKKK